MLELDDSLTVVPLLSPVRSRVVPAGTATLFKVMVEQDFLFLMAFAAPLEPEKVQASRGARREKPRTSVSGTMAGAAFTAAAPSRPMRQSLRLEAMIKKIEKNVRF
jgi:hypothetical protein